MTVLLWLAIVGRAPHIHIGETARVDLKIFVSFSGTRGRQLAEALKEWLPLISHRLRPWLSSTNIRKGAEWQEQIRLNLRAAGAALICLTPENILEPWILFEAGALSMNFEEQRLVCPILLDLHSSQLSGPLEQFQSTSL
ncbi:MAG TPA: toll/interleukin-1 receptor domain-containing protein, partial [Thermoanaerobaculia bacterium]